LKSAIIVGAPGHSSRQAREEVARVNDRDAEEITVTDVAFEKKRNHDMAWLIILLAILLGCFVLFTVFVKNLLRNFGI